MRLEPTKMTKKRHFLKKQKQNWNPKTSQTLGVSPRLLFRHGTEALGVCLSSDAANCRASVSKTYLAAVLLASCGAPAPISRDLDLKLGASLEFWSVVCLASICMCVFSLLWLMRSVNGLLLRCCGLVYRMSMHFRLDLSKTLNTVCWASFVYPQTTNTVTPELGIPQTEPLKASPFAAWFCQRSLNPWVPQSQKGYWSEARLFDIASCLSSVLNKDQQTKNTGNQSGQLFNLNWRIWTISGSADFKPPLPTPHREEQHNSTAPVLVGIETGVTKYALGKKLTSSPGG